DALVPAELAGDEPRGLREEEAAASGDRRDEEDAPELVALERHAHPVARWTEPDDPAQARQQQEPRQHLPDHAERGEEANHVVRHRGVSKTRLALLSLTIARPSPRATVR